MFKKLGSFLIFLVVAFSCNAQLLNNNLLLGNKDFFTIAVVGDSKADGAALTVTPAEPGVMYYFNDTTNLVQPVTNNPVANNTQLGSIWQPFANAFHAAFNRPVYLINGAQGGSTFTPHDFSWETTGTLYADFIAKVSAGLNAANIQQVDAVMIDLGINDVQSGDTYAAIQTSIASLFSRLETNFPGIPKLVVNTGRYGASANNNALVDIRNLLVEACRDNTNFYIAANAAPFAVQSGLYEADALHYSAAGNGVIAQQFVNWFTNPGYSKWGRSIISCLYDSPSPARKTLIDNWAISQVANGNYFRLDQFLVFKTSHASNIEFDWTFLGFGVTRTSTFSANNHISTDGVSTRYDATWSPSIWTRRSSVTNVIAGLKIKTSSTADNTTAFGTISTSGGTRVFVMGQTANTHYRVNDGTLSSGGETDFASGNLYSIARNGTAKSLYKNKVLATPSVTQANTGLVQAFPVYVGAVNNAGTAQQFFSGQYEYFFAGNFVSMDLNSLVDETETLIAGWWILIPPGFMVFRRGRKKKDTFIEDSFKQAA